MGHSNSRYFQEFQITISSSQPSAAQPARQAGHVSDWARRRHIHLIRRDSIDRSPNRIARWAARFMH